MVVVAGQQPPAALPPPPSEQPISLDTDCQQTPYLLTWGECLYHLFSLLFPASCWCVIDNTNKWLQNLNFAALVSLKIDKPTTNPGTWLKTGELLSQDIPQGIFSTEYYQFASHFSTVPFSQLFSHCYTEHDLTLRVT